MKGIRSTVDLKNAEEYIGEAIEEVHSQIMDFDGDEIELVSLGTLQTELLAYRRCFSEIIPRIGAGEDPTEIAKELVYTSEELHKALSKVMAYGR